MDGVLLDADDGIGRDMDAVVGSWGGGVVRSADVSNGADTHCFFDDGADVGEIGFVGVDGGARCADYAGDFGVGFFLDGGVGEEVEEGGVDGGGGSF